MLYLAKKIICYVLSTYKTPTVYPDHMYMSEVEEEEDESDRDQYTFVNNINNRVDDDDMLEEQDIDGFVYYDGLECIGKDLDDDDAASSDDDDDEEGKKHTTSIYNNYDDDDYKISTYSRLFNPIKHVATHTYYGLKHTHRSYFCEPKKYKLATHSEDDMKKR